MFCIHLPSCYHAFLSPIVTNGAAGVTQIQNEPSARALAGMQSERPRHEPPTALPLSLRTVQRSSISAGRIGQPASSRIFLAKWVIAGEAAMELHGKRFNFGAGDIALCSPGVPHALWAI